MRQPRLHTRSRLKNLPVAMGNEASMPSGHGGRGTRYGGGYGGSAPLLDYRSASRPTTPGLYSRTYGRDRVDAAVRMKQSRTPSHDYGGGRGSGGHFSVSGDRLDDFGATFAGRGVRDRAASGGMLTGVSPSRGRYSGSNPGGRRRISGQSGHRMARGPAPLPRPLISWSGCCCCCCFR